MIDSHAHLLSLDCYDEIISNFSDDGLEAVVNIGTTLEDSKQGIKLAEKYDNVYASVGIYPEYADSVTDNDLAVLEQIAKHKKVVAIGEIGLDYHEFGYNRKKQIEIFVKQLEIADRLGLPFCIHCRLAVADVYDILSSHKNLINHSGVMHCYSEGATWVQKFLELGLYISFSGNITFKKNDRSFLKDIPLDKILVETDSPYLSPEPLRGRVNTPKNVRITLQKIADEIGISYECLEKNTTLNAKKLYYKIKD